MAKQLNVSLAFNADTSQAKKNLVDLQNSLNQLSSISPIDGTKLTKDMQEAINSARSLEQHLTNAFNVKTGNIDLNKLNSSLRSANTDLATLTNGLLKAGLQGETAFMNVQRAISSANVQISKANGMLAQFFTTLKNTARWQLSSSLLHGFMSGLQSAYGYAQDLDESLNNIRIVTGYSKDEMASFAEEANRAAKALRTTTTEYTNASLIYYQQGLSTDEVKKRTDITIKMANVARESAETVSDQLTAVWNNFAENGTQSLEHYADAMTKLGAETASSTDEIAGGLEKFASIADMIGLSFDNAAAALATITATTRQSEDVVGTALKTIFARIQGLNLGETLDDGTTLNKYSEALSKVGISIYDANGGLKDMDNILEEMGGKWDSLTNAQQVALAQTVAGVRQYNQLVSLMDNFDIYQQNVNTAANADGELDKQQEIYAESWEAAADRVKAATEGLYNDLIPTDALIDITNGFAVIIDGVDAFVEGIGGIGGILLMLSTIALNKMGPALGNSLQMGIDKITNLNISFEGLKSKFMSGSQQAMQLREHLNAISSSGLNTATKQTEYFKNNLAESATTATKLSQTMIEQALNQGRMTDEFEVYMNDMAKVNNLQAVIEKSKSRLTAEQQQQLSLQQQQVIAASELHQKEVQNLSILEQKAASMAETADYSVYQGDNFVYENDDTLKFDSGIVSTKAMRENIEAMFTQWQQFDAIADSTSVTISSVGKNIGFMVENENDFLQMNKGSLDIYRKTVTITDRIKAIADDTNATADSRKRRIAEIVEYAKKENIISEKTADAYIKGAEGLTDGQKAGDGLIKVLKESRNSAQQFAAAAGNGKERLAEAQNLGSGIAIGMKNVDIAAARTQTTIQNVVNTMQNAIGASMSWGNALVKVAGGFSTVSMGVNGIKNMIDTLGDSSATGLEKFSSVAMGSVMAIQGLMVVIKGFNSLLEMNSARLAINTMMQELNGAADKKEAAQMILQMVLQKNKLSLDEQEILLETLKNNIEKQGIKTTLTQTAANYGLAASEMAALWPLGLIVAALAALAVAFFGTKALFDAFTVSAEEMAERTAAASEALAEEAKAAKEEAEGLKDAFKGYDEVVKTLESCTKGTDEWEEALKNVKTEIDDILEQYPDLLKYNDLLVWDDQTGTYMFNKETTDKAIADAEKRADTLTYASQMASGKAAEAKANLIKDEYDDRYVTGSYTDSNGYHSISKNINDFADASELTGSKTENRIVLEQGARDYLSTLTKTQLNSDGDYETVNLTTEEIDSIIATWSNSLDAAAEAGVDYANKTEEAANTLLQASKLAAAEMLTDENGESEYDQAAVNAGAAAVKNKYDEIYKEIYGTDGSDGLIGSQYAKGDNRQDVGSHGAEDVLTRYEAAIGKDVDWAANAVQGNDENRTFVYLEGGEEKSLSPEQLAATIAAYESTQDANLVETAAKAVQEIIGANAGDTVGTASINAISDGGSATDLANVFSTFTQDQLTAANEALADGATQEELAEMLGLSPDELTKLLESFGISFEDFAANAQTAATNVADSLTDAKKEILSSAGVTDVGSMTMGDQVAYADNINAVKTKLADEDLGEDLINSIISDVANTDIDSSTMSEFLGEVGKLDLTAEGASEQIAELAEQYGIEGDSVDNLIGSIEGLDQVYNVSTENIAQTAQSLKDIVGEGFEVGEIVSAEDMQALADAGLNVDDYFTKMADGSYALTGSAEEFNRAVNQITFNGIKTQLNDFEKARQQAFSGTYNEKYQTDSTWTASEGLSKERLAYMSSFDTGTFDFNAEQLALLEQYRSNPDLSLTSDQLQMIADMIGVVNEKENEMKAQALLTATSMEDLRAKMAELGSVSSMDYGAALIQLATNHENCTQEVEEYQEALLSGDQAQIDAATSALELAITVGETAEKYNLSAEELEDYSKRLRGLEGNENLSAEAAVKLAAANMRLDRGVGNLKGNLKDYRKALKDTNKGSAEWSKTLTDLKTDLADITNVADGDMLSDQFAEDIAASETLEKALNGDANAILELRLLAADDIIAHLDVEGDDLTTVTTAWDYLKANMEAGVAAPGVDQSDLIASFNQMIEAGNMTKDQIEAALSGLNVSANIKTTYHEQETEVPTTITTESILPNGTGTYEYVDPATGEVMTQEVTLTKRISSTVNGPPMKTTGYVPTYEIEGTTDGNGTSTTAFEKLPTPTVSQSVTKPETGGSGKSSGSKAKVERYHTVNKRIDNANRKRDRASANKDQAFGKEKLKYIKEEIDAVEEATAAYKDYYKEINDPKTGWLAKDLKEVQKLFENSKIKPEIDASGIILNWEEVLEAEKKAYEEVMSNQYAGEAAQEAAQKRWDDVNDLIQQYEDTIEELENVRDELANLERERIALELEEITTEIDFEIEISQRSIDKLDRVIEKLNRSTNNMVEIIDKLGEQVGAYQNQATWYLEGIQRIRNNALSEGRELTDDEQRKIWEYEDALEEINSSLDDIIETVNESLLEEFERWNSEIDDNIARFDTYSSTLEHYSEIIKLSGRATKDSMLLMQLQSQRTSIAMEELNAVYDKYQANLDAQKNVKEKLDLAIASGDKEDIEYWQKQYDEITKTVEENAEEVAATWQDALQAASDEFDFAVEQAVQKLKDSISKFGLDGLADRYEKAKTINEQYLSDLNKEYELNKLIRQVEGSIDNTDNLNAKRELVELLDKINKKTAEGVKLSQYDLEYMQAEYELELAKLALEEARNAKTSVRLQRGDDGNYNYVYTADQDEIASAEQNYEDKLHAIRELSQNHIDEMSDLIIQNEQELMEALAAVDKTKFETEEEYQAELNRITEYYYARDTYLRTELNKAVQNMGLVYNDTILGQLEDCSTWEKAQENLKINTNTAITTMTVAWTKWKGDTETAMTMVGTTSGTLTTKIQTDANAIASATTSLAGTINTQTSNMKKYIDDLIQKIWEWRDEYLSAIRAMQNANSLGIKYDVNADYSALMGSVEYGSEAYNLYMQYRDQKLNDPNYTGSGGKVSTARVDAFLKNGHTLEEIGKKYYTDLTEEEWIKYAGFKTGGYTGQWGPEGKLAYLHEKELVLNKEDTQNILNAVDVVRTISQKLDRQAQIAALGFASKANAHNGTSDGQTIQVEQDVTIHAEFPNATDQSEIKEAILGLVNYTAQYVARR